MYTILFTSIAGHNTLHAFICHYLVKVDIVSNNKKNGEGEYHYYDGSKYKGKIKDEKMHGYGKLKKPNGDYYEGNFL